LDHVLQIVPLGNVVAGGAARQTEAAFGVAFKVDHVTHLPEVAGDIVTLADPQRRRLPEQLARGSCGVNAVARDSRISRSAVSQHLAVLRAAGLVQSERRGRQMLYARTDAGLVPAREWMARFREIQLSRTTDASEVPLHISAVAVPVTDHDRARTFYIEKLGFQLVTDRTVAEWRWISLLPPAGSCAIGLVRAPSAGVWTGVSPLTGDLDDIYRRWARAGVAFDGPPTTRCGPVGSV
jgi:DNA-binding transcriptional ArsR family regulator